MSGRRRPGRPEGSPGLCEPPKDGTAGFVEPIQPTSNNHAGLIWAIADLLRGDYKPAEYQKVILPLVLLRRLDCVLEPTKQQVLDRIAKAKVQNVGWLLNGHNRVRGLQQQPPDDAGHPR
ncbi:MAG: type I restriction-modification system subunit M N-terminal domain-containing protein [Candidatus Limnocylindrales bacterium]